MVRAVTLMLFSASVLGHPGHGALEMHWHFEDVMWIALAIVCVGLVIGMTRKR